MLSVLVCGHEPLDVYGLELAYVGAQDQVLADVVALVLMDGAILDAVVDRSIVEEAAQE